MSDLFTKHALAFRQEQDIGQAKIIAPPNLSLLVSLLCVIVIAALAFLVTNSYTRKETVYGTLGFENKTKRIYAESAGKLERLLVNRGDTVEKGDTIAIVRSTQPDQLADGQDAIAEFNQQISNLQKARQSLLNEAEIQLSTLYNRQSALLNAINNKRQIHSLQQKKVLANEKIAARSEDLFRQGFISRIDRNRLDEVWISDQQQSVELLSSISQDQSDLQEIDLQINAHPDAIASRLLTLDTQIAQIEQSRNNLIRHSNQLIAAPLSGIITETLQQPGTSVSPSSPILSIRPRENRLIATLMIGPDAIGFIAPGQPIKLLYDTFPHQEYGGFDGRILRLSEHPLTHSDVAVIPANAPAVFLADVELAQPYVIAFGQKIELKEGSTLTADIILDKRSLLAWLMEPLLALRGRT